MRGEVIQNHVDFLPSVMLDHPVHETQELDPSSALVMLPDDPTGSDIERGEKGRGPVPLIVVRLAGHGPTVRQLQVCLRPFQRLDRAPPLMAVTTPFRSPIDGT